MDTSRALRVEAGGVAAAGPCPECRWCGGSRLEVLLDEPRYRFLVRTSSSESRWIEHHLRLVCCERCGVTSQAYVPSPAVLSAVYSRYYSSYPSFAPDEVVRDRMDDFMDHLPGMPGGGSVLEIGSYDGKLLAILKAGGWNVVGCDPNPGAAEHGWREYGVETRLDFFAPGLFERESFDLVIARVLLEHVLEPGEFMRALNDVTKPGGCVAIEVPECRGYLEAGAIFWMIEHATYFTPASLRRVLRRDGFETLSLARTRTGQRMICIARKVAGPGIEQPDPEGTIRSDRELAARFSRRFAEFRSATEAHLEQARREGRRLAAFGSGHFFTNLLGATSLRPGEMTAVFDSNPSKWGLGIPGIRQPVESSAGLSYPRVGLVIVATRSCGEILPGLGGFLSQGGRALTFFPEPRVWPELLPAA